MLIGKYSSSAHELLLHLLSVYLGHLYSPASRFSTAVTDAAHCCT